ncbi:MAG: DUF2306 domain-containing protein [Gemmatimonadota bacterium]
MTEASRVRLWWAMTFLLVGLGVAAAGYRALHISDAGVIAEPLRARLLDAVGRSDPLRAERARELAQFDAQFARRPTLTMLHVIPGALFLAFAPLQFRRRFRDRHRTIHRWTGRLLLGLLLLSTIPALRFAIGSPFAGAAETVLIVIIAGLVLNSAVRAWVAIRRGEVDRHRRWMIRLFALALGISVARVVGFLLDPLIAPMGPSVASVFVPILGAGWALAIAGGEWWIRTTGPRGE